MKKRITSLVLVLVMLLTAIPFSAFAVSAATDYTEPTFVVQSVYAEVGSTVDVKVDVKNNPGIAGATLNIDYDSNLTLIGATNGNAFSDLTLTLPGSFTNPSKFLWDSLSGEVSADDTILILKFRVSEDALENSNLNVNVSYQQGDIYDEDMEEVNFQTVNGCVTVINYIPGDVNDDGIINGKDVTSVRRHIVGGYEQTMTEEAADVNADGRINGMDVTLIRRHIVDGAELKPAPVKCNHNMAFTEYKAAACEADGNIAYWHCSACNKYFSDKDGTTEVTLENTVIPATGHTVVVDEAVAPTHTSTGLTEGSHCSVCDKVIIEQQVVPKLEKNEYSITYNIYNNDSYLQSVGVENTNPLVYTSEEGLKLANLKSPGYIFDGWYDGQGANGELVKAIPVGAKGDIELFARWSRVEYTVQFDSPDLPVESIKYTVDTGVPLINPAKQFGYTFVGWSNDDGFLVSRIKPGTTGHITLHANWTSNRNKATSYSDYEKPIIIEDDTNGQFLFIYNIGKIDNVPLNQISYLGNSDGIEINQEYDVSNTVSKETAEQIANTVANATTKSSGWTLSDEWETVFAAENETEEQKGKTEVRTDSEGNVTGGNYFVSNSSGGSSFVSNSSGGSNSSTSKVTTENSYGINRSYDNKNESYIDAKLGVSNTTTVGVEVGVDIPCTPVEVSAGIENSTTISSEVGSGLRNENSVHVDDSKSSYVGTYNENNASSYYNSTIENSSTWNSTSGYEKSYQTSRNTEVSNAISEQISKKTSHSVTEATGGSKSTNASDSYTNSNSEEYSSSLRYNSEEKTSSKQSFKYSSSEQGYYRLVNAGTVHVFAVVGYDVATSSYYTYTYNVLDDKSHIYTDFSLSDPNFRDCENGVVSFEIPYEVNEYVAGLTGKSAGLQFGLDGTVTGYTAYKDNTTVVVPQYYSANNTDNSHTAVKVTKISPTAFKGDTTIKTVVLPLTVTEIPDGAFEGCTNLETVYAYGVTSIGANAFKGCTNLKTFAIDNKVVSLGNNAFEGVNEIMVNAANVDVAESAISSGAKKVTLSIAKMEGTFDNKVVTVSDDFEYFALYGNGSEIKNLQVASNAKETVINNMILSGNKDTPLKINSENLTLNRVTIKDAPGFAIVSTAPETVVKLYSVNNIGSVSENAILCRDLTFSIANNEVASNLNVSGNVLNCGSINDPDSLLKMANGEVKNITEDEFNAYLTSIKITFNANGGTVTGESKTVYYGQAYGTLPTPTRKHYSFDGWYTSADGGTRILDSTICNVIDDITLYAHWTLSEFNVTFDANGGQVATQEKTVIYGSAYGELPVPSRNDCTFLGWFTEDGIQVTSETIFTGLEDCTVKAYWESSWVKASEIPTDAKIVDTKWKYNLTSYTTSSSKTMSGWTLYDTTSKWGSYGSWSSWQDSKVTASDSRQVETRQAVASTNYKTVYHYYRYANANGSSGNHTKTSECYNYEEYALDSQLTKTSWGGGYQYWYNGSNYHTVWKCSTFTTQEVVSYNYKTQYRYRDRSLVYTYYFKKTDAKESTSDPTGQENVSNVVKYVKYTVK